MKRLNLIILLVTSYFFISGCDNHKPGTNQVNKGGQISSLLSLEGYRYESDVCHLVGESELTLKYLDDRFDLVACPEDITLVGHIDGAEEALRMEGYRLFNVPRIEPTH